MAGTFAGYFLGQFMEFGSVFTWPLWSPTASFLEKLSLLFFKLQSQGAVIRPRNDAFCKLCDTHVRYVVCWSRSALQGSPYDKVLIQGYFTYQKLLILNSTVNFGEMYQWTLLLVWLPCILLLALFISRNETVAALFIIINGLQGFFLLLITILK